MVGEIISECWATSSGIRRLGFFAKALIRLASLYHIEGSQ